MLKQILIARHHGFCMGVKRAINIAEETADTEMQPVTILNEIVHNEAVVERFAQRGVGQVTSVEDVSEGTLIISAHGVSPDIKMEAQRKGVEVVDATCPLVTRIYDIILKLIGNNFHVIHFGELNHDETTGIVGHAPDYITVVSSREELLKLPEWKDRKLGLTVQTTAQQSTFVEIEEIARRKWPHLEVFNTICDATNQRQAAIMDLAPKVEMVLVVGSQTSANSKRLAQIANAICGWGILIGTADDIDLNWFTEEKSVKKVGLSAGASTPDFLVTEVIDRLVEISGNTAEVIYPEKRRRRIAVKREAG